MPERPRPDDVGTSERVREPRICLSSGPTPAKSLRPRWNCPETVFGEGPTLTAFYLRLTANW